MGVLRVVSGTAKRRPTSRIAASSHAAQPGSAANQLFAYQPKPGQRFSNPFTDTRHVTLQGVGPDELGHEVGIEVVAGPGAVVQTLHDQATGCCAYLWGLAAHPEVNSADLLAWMVDRITIGQQQSLREVVGLYILLIDDRRNHRVTMACDAMGLRPWFIGQPGGRLVCGSDVWAIQEAGLIAGGLNYDAIASWLRYGFDCTGQSLFSDLVQLGHGAIAVWEAGRLSQSPYAPFTGAREKPDADELVQTIHAGMERTFDALTRDRDHVSIALSGGYDSRYLAALASRRKHLRVEAFSVCDREAEGIAARMAADRLGIGLRLLPTDGSLWNVYDEPYHFTPGGFPITKQSSHIAASQRPGVPCLNGFLGDPIIRGTIDRAEQKLESQTTEDPAVVLQRIHRLKHTHARFDLLDTNIIQHCDDRTLPIWRAELARWEPTGHPFFAANVFVRQRHYLSNNFLQHLSIAEGLVPFTAWEVIQYKLRNDASCYSWETYEAIFARFFPEIADVPHNTRMGAKNNLNPRPSKCTKRWAATVLKAIARSNCISVLNRRNTIPRLIGTLMGYDGVEVVALFLYRLYLLDERLRRAGLALDWTAI